MLKWLQIIFPLEWNEIYVVTLAETEINSSALADE